MKKLFFFTKAFFPQIIKINSNICVRKKFYKKTPKKSEKVGKNGPVPSGHNQIMSRGQLIAVDKKNIFLFAALKKLNKNTIKVTL